MSCPRCMENSGLCADCEQYFKGGEAVADQSEKKTVSFDDYAKLTIELLDTQEALATLTERLARANQMHANALKECEILREQVRVLSAPVSAEEFSNHSGHVAGYSGLFDRWDFDNIIAARAQGEKEEA